MTQPFEASEPSVHAGEVAMERLAQLGVDLEVLFDALDAGDVAARQADGFSPVMAAGTLRWLETVRRLRELLVAEGWTANDVRNSPRVIRPDGLIAILAGSGDLATGARDRTPKSARSRGPASTRAVEVNGQLVIPFSEAWLADMSAERTPSVQTWVLLYHRAQYELQAELSLPNHISASGVIDGWAERIVLPTRTFGGDIELRPRDADGDDGVSFTIAAH